MLPRTCSTLAPPRRDGAGTSVLLAVSTGQSGRPTWREDSGDPTVPARPARCDVARHGGTATVAPVRRHGRRRGGQFVITAPRAPGSGTTAAAAISTPPRPLVREPRPRPAGDRRRGRAADVRRSRPTRSSATSPTVPRSSSPTASPRSPRCADARSSSAPAAATRSTPRRSSRARYCVERGEPERVHLIGRTHGYHGTHGFGTASPASPPTASASARSRRTRRVPYDARRARGGDRARRPGRVAAFFCEPVIGAGGVHLPPAGYIEAVAESAPAHGVLLVVDCVICGFGRLGTWFGIDRWPGQPDMITSRRASPAATCRSAA